MEEDEKEDEYIEDLKELLEEEASDEDDVMMIDGIILGFGACSRGDDWRGLTDDESHVYGQTLVNSMDMIHSRRPNEKSPLFKIEVRFLKKE